MTPDALKARLELLAQEKAQLEASLRQLQANLHAYQGAIQECQHWLEEITKPAQ